MASIFTRIINHEIPAFIVAENDEYIAFLDVFPLVIGHVLVVPKKETDYIFDIDDDQLSGLMLFAKKVAVAVQKSVPCKRIGVAVIGLEVPHAHIHLVPLQHIDDLNFSKPKLKIAADKLEETATIIRSNVAI
ncbi:MAG: HIT family protein [Chitinophagaceae bacterium]|nr:HIT family protein [Chitinophagaceae bacterium]